MGLDQFPMFRLGTLLARQLSAPLAARIKAYATRHPLARRVVVAAAGRLYRAAELRFKLWALALPPPPRAPPLADNEALNVGADLLGEMIVFCLGAAIVIFEVNRQAEKQEAKVLAERSQWVAVLVALDELQRELVLQQQDIDRLMAALRERGSAPHTPTPPTPTLPTSPTPTATLTPTQPPPTGNKRNNCP